MHTTSYTITIIISVLVVLRQPAPTSCCYLLLLLFYRTCDDLLTVVQQIPSCFLCLVLQARPEAAGHPGCTDLRASRGEILLHVAVGAAA